MKFCWDLFNAWFKTPEGGGETTTLMDWDKNNYNNIGKKISNLSWIRERMKNGQSVAFCPQAQTSCNNSDAAQKHWENHTLTSILSLKNKYSRDELQEDGVIALSYRRDIQFQVFKKVEMIS